MPIGIENQYSLAFNIGPDKEFEDFISEPDFISLKIIEEAGNILPIFELSFYIKDEKVFQMLHEGNDIQCSLGISLDDKIRSNLTVTGFKSTIVADNYRIATVTGVWSNLEYIVNSNKYISAEKSAVEVIIEKAGTIFGSKNVITNIEKSKDSQKWIQAQQSDRKFINHLWLHADLGSSFPAIGISAEGKFILKDIQKAKLEKPDWNFGPYFDNVGNNIRYDGSILFESNAGFINSWLGYDREMLRLNIDTSFDDKVMEDVQPSIAMSSKLPKSLGVNKKFGSVELQNSNMHSKYWNVYQHNMKYLSSMLSTKVTFTVTNIFIRAKVLDLVQFYDTGSGDISDKFSSGLYFVNKIVRNISRRNLSTTVVLSRESMNSVRASQ